MDIIATRGFQGAHVTVYQGFVEASKLIAFLGHDPRSRNWKKLDKDTRTLYESVQRETRPNRIRDLTEYTKNRIMKKGIVPGALPAISIGTIAAPSFKENTNGSGMLRLGAGQKIVFDGIGRITALLNILDVSSIEPRNIPMIAVTIFTPSRGRFKVADLAQLFYDFNVMRATVTAKQARGKDSASPYTQISKAMMRLPFFAAMPEKGHAFMNQEKMARFIRGATEGIAVSDSVTKRVPSPVVTPKSYPDFIPAFERLWTRISNKAPSFGSATSVMFYQHGYAAIASVLWKFTNGRFDLATDREIDRYADAIASIDWEKSNPEWVGVMVAESEEGGKLLTLGGGGRLQTEEYVADRVSRFLKSA